MVDAKRRAINAAHEEKLKAAGFKRVTSRLDEEGRAALAALAKVHGTKDKALKFALLAALKLTASGPVGEVGAEGDTRPNQTLDLKAEMSALLREMPGRQIKPTKPARTPKPLPSPDMKGKVGKAVQPQEKGLGVGVQIGPSPVVPGSRLKKR